MLRKSGVQVRPVCLLGALFLISVSLCTHRSSASDTTGLVTKPPGDFVVAEAVGNNHLNIVSRTKRGGGIFFEQSS
jgi:hypothetical protein